MTRTIPMRNGIFLAPFHSLDQDPTEALHRDLELLENLDRLGYEEAWIGEHHSAGFEIIASPEVFIAAAAERTTNIRLGTGVVSLPYHNPLMTANRIIQLDHQTRGRVMLGVGPGLLPSDAMMLGIDPMIQRERMMEGLKVIMRLFNGEVVTEKSDWYNLINARALATARGIALAFTDSGVEPFAEEGITTAHSLTVRLVAGQRVITIAGRAHPAGAPRVTRIGEFHVDVHPRGTLLILTNRDVPGVIGHVGTALGAAGVNIAEYHQARLAQGGEALAAVAVDGRLEGRAADALRHALEALPDVRSATVISLTEE